MIYDLRGISHLYAGRAGAVRALDDVTLRVSRGERVALLGPSGAGKSTLLRLLNATLRPTRGALCFESRDLSALGPGELRAVRRRIGTIFQHPSLVPSLTALQNALCGRLGSWNLLRSLRALVAPAPEDVRAGLAALETVGLSGKAAARADELSGGQQQRVAIARVLVQDPEVVLADEPFASLDPGLTVQLADLMFAVTQRRTLVAAMHDVDLALQRFQRIVGVRAGRVVFDVPAAEVSPELLQELYAREARRAG
ncbi:MAG TPA: phosphonate ABC transporter ATP-binding protein [Myxococcales bacterium]